MSSSNGNGKKFTTDKPSIDEIRRLKKPPTATVEIVLNSELNEQIEAVVAELAQAKIYDAEHSEPDTAPAVQARLDGLVEEAKASVVEFELAAIPRKAYDQLLADHQPSEEQKQNGFSFDPDTFPPALLAASVTYPELKLSDATEIWEEWPIGETQKLFAQAAALNQSGSHTLPKSARGTG